MSLLPTIECDKSRPGSDAGGLDRRPLCLRASIAVDLKPGQAQERRPVELRCLWFGARSGPTVIVQGGISAGRDVCASPAHTDPGWWQELVGPGKAVDTSEVRILAIDWLDAESLGVDCVTTEDQADALAALLDALQLRSVAAFVGGSYGAMVGLAFAARHGERLDRLVAIAGAHRPHPLASAQRAVQRGILQLGIDSGREAEGVSLARQLALTTYRGSAELAERFAGPARQQDGRWQLPVEAWLEHHGDKFARRCSAQRYLSLSRSIDLHRVDPATVRVPVNLIGIASDRLVPLADLCELQRALGGHASLDVVDSRCGHDGFLLEHAQLTPLLGELLRQPPLARRPPDAVTRTRPCEFPPVPFARSA